MRVAECEGRPPNSACSWRPLPSRRLRSTRRAGPPGRRARPQLMPALERQREWQPLVDLPLTIRACVDTM